MHCLNSYIVEVVVESILRSFWDTLGHFLSEVDRLFIRDLKSVPECLKINLKENLEANLKKTINKI